MKKQYKLMCALLFLISITFAWFHLAYLPTKVEGNLYMLSWLEKNGNFFLPKQKTQLPAGMQVQNARGKLDVFALNPSTKELLFFEENATEGKVLANHVDSFWLHPTQKHLYYYKQTAFLNEQSIGNIYYVDLATWKSFEIDSQIKKDSFVFSQEGDVFAYVKAELPKKLYLKNVRGTERQAELQENEELLYLSKDGDWGVIASLEEKNTLSLKDKIENTQAAFSLKLKKYIFSTQKAYLFFEEKNLPLKDKAFGFDLYFEEAEDRFLMASLEHFYVGEKSQESFLLKPLNKDDVKVLLQEEHRERQKTLSKENVSLDAYFLTLPLKKVWLEKNQTLYGKDFYSLLEDRTKRVHLSSDGKNFLYIEQNEKALSFTLWSEEKQKFQTTLPLESLEENAFPKYQLYQNDQNTFLFVLEKGKLWFFHSKENVWKVLKERDVQDFSLFPQQVWVFLENNAEQTHTLFALSAEQWKEETTESNELVYPQIFRKTVFIHE